MQRCAWLSVCLWLVLAGCSATSGESTRTGQAAGQGGTAGAGNGAAANGGSGAGSGFGNSDGGVPIGSAGTLAPLVDAGGTVTRDPECGKLKAIIRDFTPQTNPDFEKDIPFDLNSLLMGGGQTGIVKTMLENGYPAYAATGSTPNTTGPAEFYQWYVDTPNVNIHLEVEIPLTEDTPGHFVYDSTAFFPIDDMGFGNYMSSGHNFHFTTEVRTKFTYHGGEVFTFRGDDDLWLFVNGVLAIDLGGMHSPLERTVNMDAFAMTNGLEKGKTYSMDIFHAERHTVGSNFHIETTIDCFTVVEPPPPPPPPE